MARFKIGNKGPKYPEQLFPDVEQLEAEVAMIPKPTEPPPPPVKKPPRIYTREEAEQQVALVLDWRIDGFDKRGIMKALRAKWPGMGNRRLGVLWERVDRVFLERNDSPLVARKESALSRLRRDAAVARVGDWDAGKKAWKHRPNLQTALRIEELISKIEGTQAPVQVNVNQHLTSAMVTVVARLSRDDAAEYMAEALEQGRLADLARRELPALLVEACGTDPSGIGAHDAEE